MNRITYEIAGCTVTIEYDKPSPMVTAIITAVSDAMSPAAHDVVTNGSPPVLHTPDMSSTDRPRYWYKPDK